METADQTVFEPGVDICQKPRYVPAVASREVFVFLGKGKRICSCLLLDDKYRVAARGLSFGSFSEKALTRKEGKRRAIGRARAALALPNPDRVPIAFQEAVRPEVAAIVESAGFNLGPSRSLPTQFRYKAESCPLWSVLTDREQTTLYRLLAGLLLDYLGSRGEVVDADIL